MSDLAQLVIRVDSLEAKVAAKDLDKLSDAGTFAEKAMKVLAGTLAVLGLAAVAKESAMLAARFETMGVVMRTAGLNAGYASAQMTAFENSLRKTGISMIESRNALTSLSTANIDLSKATGLARAAQDLAVVAGINSSEAFARMIHGIKSGEQEVLKTMGLNVQWEASYKKLSATLGKSANDLTEQEKLHARLGVVMKASAGYAGIYEASMSTAGKQMASMTRYVEDLKVKFGAAFGPAIIAGVQAATEALKNMSSWMDKLAADGTLAAVASGMGSIASTGIDILIAPIKFVIENMETLKVIAIAVGVAMAYAFAPTGLTALQNLVLPLVSSLYGLAVSAWAYASGATAASIATGAFNAALAILASPITAIVAGVVLLTGAFLALDQALYGDIDAVKANLAAQEEHIAKSKTWLAMREDALAIEKKIAALTKDGGKDGPATREIRIQETVNRSMVKDKTYDQREMENLRFYAEMLVNKQDKLRAVEKAQSDAAQAEASAAQSFVSAGKAREAASKAVAAAIEKENESLDRERILMEQGTTAAYAYDLAKDKISGKAKQDLILKRILIDYDKAHAEYLKDEAAAAAKYNDEIYKLADAGPTMLRAKKDPFANEGAQLTEQMMTPGELRNRELTRTEALLRTGAIGWETYTRKMAELEMQGSTLLQSLHYGLEGMGNDAADAFGRWVAGMDGAALSFRKMTQQMIADMARMAAQKGFQELLGYAFSGWSGVGTAPGGAARIDYGTGTPSSGGPLNFGPIPEIAQGGASGQGLELLAMKAPSAPQGGTTINSNVTVNVSQDGKVDAKASGNMGAQAGAVIESVVIQTIQKLQRPGGMLNPTGSRS